MKKRLMLGVAVSCLLFVFAAVHAQQPQTSTAPIYAANAKYVNGVAPGYWATPGSGLTLNLSAGTANCAGTITTYAGGTLTMANNTTNYVYLDATSSCAPTSNTSGFTGTTIPIAKVVTSGGVITTVTDVRTAQYAPTTGTPGSGTVTSVTVAGTSSQILVTGTCTITTTGTCTLSLPNGVILGTDGSAAGTLQLANASAAAHTIWGSGATTSNTINGFATVPTTGHLLDCTVTSTTCLLHDSGLVTANEVNASSPGAGVAHFAGGTQTLTSSAVVGSDMASGTVGATQLAAQYSKLRCETGLGDGLNAMAAGTYLQSMCYNDSGVTWTITGIKCYTDNGGSSTLNAAGNTLGSLLTGAITCSSSWVAGTQTANVALTSGDYIKFTFVADGSSKQTTWLVSFTQ